ncbi:hypothetical protein BJ741DRAFT_602748 [Chytriomyces cf. hyalinus JEL632]|nr:hypothetical protein BJ741DRAFT_602748 [Chytriomyces cf. hyalinus JEL632]
MCTPWRITVEFKDMGSESLYTRFYSKFTCMCILRRSNVMEGYWTVNVGWSADELPELVELSEQLLSPQEVGRQGLVDGYSCSCGAEYHFVGWSWDGKFEYSKLVCFSTNGIFNNVEFSKVISGVIPQMKLKGSDGPTVGGSSDTAIVDSCSGTVSESKSKEGIA